MTIAKDHLWIVFDNLHALGRVNEQFAFRDNRNKLVGVLGEDSQFEVSTEVTQDNEQTSCIVKEGSAKQCMLVVDFPWPTVHRKRSQYCRYLMYVWQHW